MKKAYPGIKIIPYSEMPEHHLLETVETTNSESEELIAVLRDKGCDAVISGNAG